MKNISLSLATVVLSLASVNHCHAQSNASFASNVVVMNTNNGNNNTEAGSGGIDARALTNFKKEYSKVGNAKWEQISDGFISKFVQKDIQFCIGYSTKGAWQYTERTYTATNLPIDVKKQVENAYSGYTINLVEEITTNQRTVYIVHIESKEWAMKIKVDGTEMESIEEYKKFD